MLTDSLRDLRRDQANLREIITTETTPELLLIAMQYAHCFKELLSSVPLGSKIEEIRNALIPHIEEEIAKNRIEKAAYLIEECGEVLQWLDTIRRKVLVTIDPRMINACDILVPDGISELQPLVYMLGISGDIPEDWEERALSAIEEKKKEFETELALAKATA